MFIVDSVNILLKNVFFAHNYVQISHLPLHLKLVDWPLLVQGIKPIYEAGPMYKSFVYIHLYQQNQQYTHLCW